MEASMQIIKWIVIVMKFIFSFTVSKVFCIFSLEEKNNLVGIGEAGSDFLSRMK